MAKWMVFKTDGFPMQNWFQKWSTDMNSGGKIDGFKSGPEVVKNGGKIYGFSMIRKLMDSLGKMDGFQN